MFRVSLFFSLLLVSLFSLKTTISATSVNIFQITTDGSIQSTPVIYKDTVLWTDWRNSATSDLDIFQYSLKENRESPLIVQPGQQWAVGFNGTWIVYSQYFDSADPKSYDVQALNIKTGEDVAITDDVGAQVGEDVEGDIVLYIDGGACGKLYAYDLKQRENQLVTDSACSPAKAWNNIIVWSYAAPGGTNVYGYDLKTKLQFDIASDDGFQEVPDIHGHWVAWLHRLSGAHGDYNAIKVKNLVTGEVKTVYESTTDALNSPAISDRYVVWSQSSAPHVGGVWGANYKTGEVFEIQEQGPHQNSHTATNIWKNTAVWMAWRTGNGDIYGSNFGSH